MSLPLTLPQPPEPPPDFADPEPFRPFPFLDLLGARLIAQPAGRGRLELEIATRHLRDLGIMHGGVLATILDSVLGMAAASLAPLDHFAVTVQLNLNFIRPAWEGEILIATGEVQHSGRKTAVSRGEVRTESGFLVGAGMATFMYVLHTDSAKTQYTRKRPD